MKNKLIALILIVMVAITGCSSNKGLTDSDIQDYVQYSIDEVYFGVNDQKYFDLVDITLEESQEITLQGMTYEAEVFIEYFDMYEVSEEHFDRIISAYQTLYKSSKYEISEPIKKDLEYIFEVTIEPILTISEFLDVLLIKLDEETDIVYNDEEYNEMVISLFEDYLVNNPVNYGEPVLVFVKVELVDSYYNFTENSISTVDQHVILY